MIKSKQFICRVNGHSIYYCNSFSIKDKNRFIIIKNKKQIYDTHFLRTAICMCIPMYKWSNKQRKRFYKLIDDYEKF